MNTQTIEIKKKEREKQQ